MLRRSRERGKSAGKIITHTAVRSLAHATCTGRELLLTNAQAVTITRRAHLMRLRVRYASSRPTVPPGTGDNCVLRQGKGISAYMRHNTICDAPCVHHARPRGICARQRARLPCALCRIAVRRLMENALLPLNAVLRLPTIQSHLSTYGTARVEDLTRAFSRARRFKRGDNCSHLLISCCTIQSITEASFTLYIHFIRILMIL